MYEISEVVSQLFVAFFLIAYSVVFGALAWWALRLRLGPAVKTSMALVLIWAMGTLHFLVWHLKRERLASWSGKDSVNAPS